MIRPVEGRMGEDGWLTCDACGRTWHPRGFPVHHCPATAACPRCWRPVTGPGAQTCTEPHGPPDLPDGAS